MNLNNVIQSATGRFTGRTASTGSAKRRSSGGGRLNTPGRDGISKPGAGGVSGLIRSILNRR